MINKLDKNNERQRRHARVRKTVHGTSSRPRLCVYRSLSNIYAQIIDDDKGITLASASTMDKAMRGMMKGKTKLEQATIVGQEIAKRATEKGIKAVVFDRGGYLFTGRIKNISDGARAGGLEF